jgi:phosphoglycolate phosphatase-like HAD superfamily hydrolase
LTAPSPCREPWIFLPSSGKSGAPPTSPSWSTSKPSLLTAKGPSWKSWKPRKQQGILLGIITRNSLQSVQKAFRKFKHVDAQAFDTIISRDDSLPKPHPDGVHQAAKRMGISLRELLVVGDFRFDVMAGHEAGARTALLTNGRESVMLPGDPEPDYIVTSLEEIPEIIGILIPP